MTDCEQCGLELPGGKGHKRLMHEECKLLTVNLSRRCKKCKKVKAASSFSRDSSRSEGRFPYCKPCQMTSTAKFQNPDADPNGHTCPVDDVPVTGHRNRRFCSDTCKNKVSALRKKYGMEIADFRRLVEATGGKCPICKQRPTSWQVDHNHSTRMAAGVVCINCNVGLLAYSGHDVDRARALVAYLETTPCERLGIQAQGPEESRASNLQKTWNHNRFIGRVKA